MNTKICVKEDFYNGVKTVSQKEKLPSFFNLPVSFE